MKKKEKKQIGILVIVVSIVLLGGFFAKSTEEPKLALKDDLCPTDRTHIQGYVSIILDLSEPLTGGNAEQLTTQVIDISKKLPRYTKIVVFDAIEAATSNQFILARCTPRSPRECSGADELTASCGAVAKNYKKNFEDPIAERITEFLTIQQVRKSSPIIEAIKSVSDLTEFKEAKSKNLYVFSDMLQNMREYSHYSDNLPNDEYDILKQWPYYEHLKPDLLGAEVDIFYILRKKNSRMQTANHKKFWKDFFSASNVAQTNMMDWNFANADLDLSSSEGEINLYDESRTPENLLPLDRVSSPVNKFLHKDVVLVLDNSGSMKTNDPNFLTKKAVTDFIKKQGDGDRLAIISFDQKVKLLMPLAEGTHQQQADIISSLRNINYRGLLTDTPAAIEQAIYELKTNGRNDANKIIVFMTDGIIDTGNPERDLERGKWLKQELTLAARNNNIKIYGIAFSSEADYQLIQSITQKTKGEYYRALKAEDLEKVMTSINETISW